MNRTVTIKITTQDDEDTNALVDSLVDKLRADFDYSVAEYETAPKFEVSHQLHKN